MRAIVSDHFVIFKKKLTAFKAIKVWNLNSSFQDGKALLAALHGLHGEEPFNPMEHPPVRRWLP